jgi:hypothetical protein
MRIKLVPLYSLRNKFRTEKRKIIQGGSKDKPDSYGIYMVGQA